MAEVKSADFKKASARAVHDDKLQHSLDHVMKHFVEARASSIENDFGDESWDAMRDRAAAITEFQTVLQLDPNNRAAQRMLRQLAR